MVSSHRAEMWSLPSGNLPSRAGDRQASQLAINSCWDRMNANTEIKRKQQVTSEKLGGQLSWKVSC